MIKKPLVSSYDRLISDISILLEEARRSAARSVNALLTATYWEIGRRIVEYEQSGKLRANYGEEILIRLSGDLTTKYGRGFSGRNLRLMRGFYLGWEICPTPSGKMEARAKFSMTSREIRKKKRQTLSANFGAQVQSQPGVAIEGQIWQTVSAKSEAEVFPLDFSARSEIPLPYVFPLPRSHYVRLMSVENP